MKKVLIACLVAASLTGCSGFHRERGTESSGTSTPPAAQSQPQQNAAARPDWNDCADHPYMPGPARNCE